MSILYISITKIMTYQSYNSTKYKFFIFIFCYIYFVSFLNRIGKFHFINSIVICFTNFWQYCLYFNYCFIFKSHFNSSLFLKSIITLQSLASSRLSHHQNQLLRLPLSGSLPIWKQSSAAHFLPLWLDLGPQQ